MATSAHKTEGANRILARNDWESTHRTGVGKYFRRGLQMSAEFCIFAFRMQGAGWGIRCCGRGGWSVFSWFFVAAIFLMG